MQANQSAMSSKQYVIQSKLVNRVMYVKHSFEQVIYFANIFKDLLSFLFSDF